MDTERGAEHLARLRHAIKKAMGDYINRAEHEDGGLEHLQDNLVLAAVTSVMCEFLHALGGTVDDDFVTRVRATFGAVVLAQTLTDELEKAGGVDKMPMPTTTLQ